MIMQIFQKMRRRAASWKKPAAIILALGIQVVAAVFFVGESLHELATDSVKRHALTELPMAIALCVGAFFTVQELRRILLKLDQQERALSLAGGAFRQAVDTQFDLWRLTRGERDVAWFLLKGVEVTDIAAMRGSASGTVRAQLAHVYAKSGVTSRAQFVSVFLDELLTRTNDRP